MIDIDNKYKKLGKNTVLVFIGNIGGRVITLLMLPFYTKWLSTSGYGIVDLITVYSSFLLGLVSLCLADAIFVFPKDENIKNQKEYFSSGILIACITLLLTGLIFSGINYLSEIKSIENSFTEYIYEIFVMICVSFLQSYMQQFARSLDRVKTYAISGLILPISIAVLSFLLIPEYGVYGYIYAQIISLLISSTYIAFAISIRKYFSIYLFSWNSAKEMLKYSLPLIPNGILWWCTSALNRPILEYSVGIDSIGLFAVANKFPTVIVLIFGVFSYSWQISIIEEFRKKDFSKFYNNMLQIIFAIITLLSLLIGVSSKFLITKIVDEDFYDAWYYVPILCIPVLLNSLSVLVGGVFSASRESKYLFFSSIGGAVSSAILNFILIPLYGVMGAAISLIISYGIVAILRIYYANKYVRLTKYNRYIFLLLLNILLVLILIYIDNLTLRAVLVSVIFIIFIYINNNIIRKVSFYIKANLKK